MRDGVLIYAVVADLGSKERSLLLQRNIERKSERIEGKVEGKKGSVLLTLSAQHEPK